MIIDITTTVRMEVPDATDLNGAFCNIILDLRKDDIVLGTSRDVLREEIKVIHSRSQAYIWWHSLSVNQMEEFVRKYIPYWFPPPSEKTIQEMWEREGKPTPQGTKALSRPYLN